MEPELNTTPVITTEEKKVKVKIDQNTLRTIGISALTVIVVIIIATLIVWFNRAALFNRFATDYVKGIQNAELGPQTAGTTANPISPIFTQESFVVDTVKKTNPAVVAIVITKDVPKYETYYQQVPDPFGGVFGGNSPFGNLFQVPQQRQNGTEKKEVGGGSGFFVTKDGLIVTNRHVVDDKTAEYTVFTNDGKKHTATVIARDSVLDVALIKIDGAGYTPLELGDSDNLKLGQSVIAIGNALGEFRNTVSVGVVSGLSRTITAGDNSGQSEQLDQVIQTDAAINPGNSGGPLLNLSGKVIGVNVAVAQGSQNIGFTLPINSIKGVIESVKATGKIVRPYIGVRYTQITPELKDANKLSVDYGILVRRGDNATDLAVIPNSPASKAGIVENDIILEIDGKKLDSNTNFASMIREHKVGDTIKLKVLSNGQEKTVQLKLEAAPE